MSTLIKINCTECNKEFKKDKNEISRRKYKSSSTNFFCSRSCGAIHSGKHRKNFSTPSPQHGNKWNQKYHPSMSWYMTRVKKDQRLHVSLNENIMSFHDHCLDIWDEKCAISKVKIYPKNNKGYCEFTNPFFIASLDRINSSLPYQVGNVQWISLAFNYAKNSNNNFNEDYLEFIKAQI